MRRVWVALGFAWLCGTNAEAGAATAQGVSLATMTLNSERLNSNGKPLRSDQIRRILVEESIADYLANVGNCPCPYNRARNGSRCGRRSAYDRAGGEAPLCYPKDVSDQMVQQYREAHAED